MLDSKSHKNYIKGAIVVMLLSSLSVLAGAIFKIQHWPYGSAMLLIGMIGEVVAFILLGIGLSKYNKYRKSQIQ